MWYNKTSLEKGKNPHYATYSPNHQDGPRNLFGHLACRVLGLTYATSAGIIAILSITDTRRSTARLAYNRFMSMLLALFLGSLAFQILGYNLWALGFYLATYVPLAFLQGWEIGITPSSVLVTHLLLEKSTSIALLGNEVTIS